VSNQGPPILAGDLQRIFDRFYRKTGADGVAGIGLGLSICKGIVDAHGGSIWAENLPDGLAFNFTIPTLMDASPKLTPPGEDLSK
jgi:two-component system sensor histidine kinase KdpD